MSGKQTARGSDDRRRSPLGRGGCKEHVGVGGTEARWLDRTGEELSLT